MHRREERGPPGVPAALGRPDALRPQHAAEPPRAGPEDSQGSAASVAEDAGAGGRGCRREQRGLFSAVGADVLGQPAGGSSAGDARGPDHAGEHRDTREGDPVPSELAPPVQRRCSQREAERAVCPAAAQGGTHLLRRRAERLPAHVRRAGRGSVPEDVEPGHEPGGHVAELQGRGLAHLPVHRRLHQAVDGHHHVRIPRFECQSSEPAHADAHACPWRRRAPDRDGARGLPERVCQRLRSATLLPHLPQPARGHEPAESSAGLALLGGAERLRVRIPSAPARGRPRLCVRVAGAREQQALHAGGPRPRGSGERLEPHARAHDRPVHDAGRVPVAGGAHRRHASHVQGDAADAAGAPARFPSVPDRLPSELLRRHSVVVHPDAELDPVGLSAGHAPAGSAEAQSEGGSPPGDLAAPEDHVELPPGAVPGGGWPAEAESRPVPDGQGPLGFPADAAVDVAAGRRRVGVRRPADQQPGCVRRCSRDRVAAGAREPGSDQRTCTSLPLPRDQLGRGWALLRAERDRQPVALPEQPHPLLLLRHAAAVRQRAFGHGEGADHPRPAGAPDRAPPASLGPAHYVH
mmetsp:Transcript_1979/g.8731  ORF Transcript_1979/g.8731 Transcript_1979/m.8731 type:complete len:579 (+) Transcript_1979:5009-6745(+)